MSTEISDAQTRARRLYRSPAYAGAYMKGARAALAGVSKDRNPYRLDQTWRAGYHRAWASGHMSIGVARDEVFE